jgi:hypothetical protein
MIIQTLSLLRGPGGRPLLFHICALIMNKEGQTVREDDGKLLEKDARILGPVMRSNQGLLSH